MPAAGKLRLEFESEPPFDLPLEQAAAVGARRSASGRWLPGAFAFDPETGDALPPRALAGPACWNVACSDDGLPATRAYVGLDASERRDHVFPTRSSFAAAGTPVALYAVHNELGVVRRWNTQHPDPTEEAAWTLAGRVGPCELPSWALGAAGGRSILVTPTDDGPEALHCPALSGRRVSDLVRGARCLSAPAGRAALHGGLELMLPGLVNGRLTLFTRADDHGDTWRAEAVNGIEGPPPGDALAAPVMDTARRVFWVGSTGVLIAPEDEPPFWLHFEPTFRPLRRARPYKDGGVLWQLGRLEGPEGEGFAFRKLTPGPAMTRPVQNPHFSGGPLTYAAPDQVRRYVRPWHAPEVDDVLRMTGDRGFLAPLLTFLGPADGPPSALVMWVESPVAHPFVLDEPGPHVPVGLQLHEPRRRMSERLDGGLLQGVEALSDVLVVIFEDRLFALHRNNPHEFAPCVSWPVAPSR